MNIVKAISYQQCNLYVICLNISIPAMAATLSVHYWSLSAP